MCFWKSKQSKVLRAKRAIVVYKIGESADENTFVPYYMNGFTYKTGEKYLRCPDFNSNSITVGFHGYINIIVTDIKSLQLYAVIQKNTEQKSLISIYSTLQDRLYLGKFIIPKGATYCLNSNGEVVSDSLMYTGNHIKITLDRAYNTKELWKEK